jgi:hypothetical protein
MIGSLAIFRTTFFIDQRSRQTLLTRYAGFEPIYLRIGGKYRTCVRYNTQRLRFADSLSLFKDARPNPGPLVVFAEKGDLLPLGARTLEGLNLVVNSRDKKLVAAGPIPVA